MKTIKTLFLILSFMMMNHVVRSQTCLDWEAWSCYYTPSGAYICGCVDTNSAPAKQCSGGQVLACRVDNKCMWECECMDTEDVAFWLSHGHTCHTAGGNGHGGWWHHWHGHLRSGSDELDAAVENSIQLFPNPAISLTSIVISLEQDENVTLKVLDVSGKVISILADAFFEKGRYEMEWNVSNMDAGIYFLRMESGKFVQTEKIIITK